MSAFPLLKEAGEVQEASNAEDDLFINQFHL